MSTDRREFLGLLAAGTVAAAAGGALPAHAQARAPIRAIAFDAFPIFDPRPIFALAERLFPGRGAELSNAWRIRQFDYQWLRALAKQYADFWQATEDALVFTAKSLKLDMSADQRGQLMNAYLELKAWPDVAPALKTLKEAGVRLALLSNFSPKMLEAAVRSAGLDGAFDRLLSTDQQKTYKPDPRAYQMAIDAFGLAREEILFAPFAGWDASGAKWFGYRTFWVNRLAAPPEELGVTVDASGANLTDLVKYVKA